MTDCDMQELVTRHWHERWDKSPFIAEGEIDSISTAEMNAWARFTIVPILSIQQTLGSIGNRKFHRKAQVIAQIFVRDGNGTAGLVRLAKSARDVFEGVTLNQSDPIDFYQVDIVSRPANGPWIGRNVVALCNYYETK